MTGHVMKTPVMWMGVGDDDCWDKDALEMYWNAHPELFEGPDALEKDTMEFQLFESAID